MKAQQIVDHYTGCLIKHRGDLAKEVDWKDQDTCDKRNQAFLDNLYHCGMFPSDSLLDFGMGTGSFYGFSRRQKQLLTQNYSGCDASLAMVEEAKLRYPDIADNLFHLPLGKELSSSSDFSILSGVFTEKRSLSKYEMLYEVVVPTLKMVWHWTNQALLVNFMNSHSLPLNKQRDELLFLDSNELVNLAKDLGASRYKIVSNYLEFEHLLVLEKK